MKRNWVPGDARGPFFVSATEHTLDGELGVSVGEIAHGRVSVTETRRATELVVEVKVEESRSTSAGKINNESIGIE